MARVTKEATVRREELLDVAFDLFLRTGFEGTSIEAITTTASVAKGTFYHYFDSKDDLLVQLVSRFGEELLGYLETQMLTVEGNALERFRTLMRLSAGWKIARYDMAINYVPFLYKTENYTFRHRLFDAWRQRTRPLVLALVSQGALEGTFAVAEPEATTDIILAMWFDVADRMWERALAAPDEEAFANVFMKGTDAIWEAQERVLGAPEGCLRAEIDMEVVKHGLIGMRQQIVAGASGGDIDVNGRHQ